jgi:hypothetical protein
MALSTVATDDGEGGVVSDECLVVVGVREGKAGRGLVMAVLRLAG